ncbi:MAG TPA: bestrophin family ion channel, partial [Phnomibacter sp.]|nr:bestrophin family ion channel [Phnomibacter sp.]
MLLNTTIPWQYIFGKVKRELTLVVGYALTIAVIQEVFKLHHISVPISVPMMLGTIISLLLAFRSNQAYDRWWEARIIWGAVVNDSRTFTRQLLTFTRTGVEDDPEAKFAITRMVRRQIAWCYALGQSLRKKNDFSQVERLLSRKEWLYIQPYKNMPNALLKLHGRDVKLAYKNGWINEYQQVAIDETVSRLCDSMGKCERIKNTVFPATYSLYIHFAIVLFIILLPFSLVEYFGLLEVPMVTA